MQTADFDYQLPEELIAQQPADRRDQSRLLVLHRATGRIEHRHFHELPEFLRPGDLVVLNDSKVIPARLRGFNARTGGEFEVLLLEENSRNDWWVMLRPGRRARPGTLITFYNHQHQPVPLTAEVVDVNPEGHRRLRFGGEVDVLGQLADLGEIPLPPYIRREPFLVRPGDLERYQTVFAQRPGSVAAPTAGLHFTPAVLAALHARGVKTAKVTLHVGLGTFAPVKAESLTEHTMHEERYEIGSETAEAIAETHRQGGRVLAVGTTSLRVLESVAAATGGLIQPRTGRTRLFVHPPYRFQCVDLLLTNFHLPKSTLLMLVSAFAAPGETRGRALALAAYAEAIAQRYRFFSYGDAMLLV